jgi:hypothetical protein
MPKGNKKSQNAQKRWSNDTKKFDNYDTINFDISEDIFGEEDENLIHNQISFVKYDQNEVNKFIESK